MRPLSLLLLAPLAASLACAGADGGPAPAASTGAPVAAPAPPPPAASAPPAAGAPTPPAAAAAPAGSERCGDLDCLLFGTPAAALARVLEAQPRVLAVGETHAQKGDEGVTSATRRFTESLLPALAPHASDLIIELWVADPRCSKEKVAKVEEQQKAVTQSQAKTNQNEFVTLAEKAKALGVEPHVLRPTCEEYDLILRAGDDAIDPMLTMITRLTAAKVKDLLAKRDPAAGKMVVTYGGALHNDAAPRPGRERWSFGPDLAALTGGKFVELDIIVREYMKDNDSWRALPWSSHFDKEQHRDKTVLYRPGPASYALIFPAAR
jgi:hypothetical protein